MGINLIRVTANVAGGSTYTPNFLLSSFCVLTLSNGSITIAPATGVSAGDIIAIKVIFPMTGTTTLTFAPEYLLYGNVQEHTGGGAQITYGFFFEGGGFQRIWQGAS